jgi:tRNA threonylcarbamoyladenosine biosynthesis protein TsaE
MKKTDEILTMEMSSLAELPAAVSLIQDRFAPYRVFALHGEMGAGKTTFVREFCEALGCKDWISSPTFSIVNEYEYAKGEHSDKIYHFDMYRLKDMEEALQMGVQSYLESGAYCLIEWPELLEDFLPEDTIKISFSVLENETRKLEVVPFFLNFKD